MADPIPPPPPPKPTPWPTWATTVVGIVICLAVGAAVAWFSKPPTPPVPPVMPTISLPASITIEVGDMAKIDATTNGTEIFWVSPAGIRLLEFKKDKCVTTSGKAPGVYRIQASAVLGDKVSDPPAVCVLTVTGVAPPPPVPPGPNPPVPPVPPGPPAPITDDGFRVMIIYDKDKVAKYTVGQYNAIFGKVARDYLFAKCVVGTDGKTKEVRMWTPNTDVTGESTLWKAAFSRPRAIVPWILISNGTSGFEGPLPDSLDDTMALLKKYGG